MNVLPHERPILGPMMTTALRNALLIHSPNAGGGGNGRRRTLDAARHIFAAGGIHSDLAETTGPGHATEIARRAAYEGRGLVITCGGDGTLNEVINGLAANQNGHRVPLALLPGGTANILAKELDLPWDIPSAAEKLVRGTVKEIALGMATPLENPEKKKYFLSVGGAGPDGMIVYSLDIDLKARLGILAYWWQGAREVFRYSFPHFRVVIGDQKLDGRRPLRRSVRNHGPHDAKRPALFELLAHTLDGQPPRHGRRALPQVRHCHLRAPGQKSSVRPSRRRAPSPPPRPIQNRPPRPKTSHPRRALVAAAFRPALFSCFFLECGGLPPLFFHAQPDQAVRPPGFLESLVFVGLVLRGMIRPWSDIQVDPPASLAI